jgi:hypothetical protein
MPYLNNSTDQFNAFPAWYKKYLASIVNQEITNVSILKKTVQFGNDMSIKEIATDTLYVIQ